MTNPRFRCAGCGQTFRLLFADADQRMWCSDCYPSDDLGSTVGPVKPADPSSDMGCALAETRPRALFGSSVEIVRCWDLAAERAA